jgi:hypothetical protein
VHSVKIRFDQGVVHVPRKLGRAVDLGGPGRDLVIGERAHRFAKRLLLFRQGEDRTIRAHDSMLR